MIKGQFRASLKFCFDDYGFRMKYFILILAFLFLLPFEKAYALDCPVEMPRVYLKNTSAKMEVIKRVSSGNLAKLHGGSYRPGQPNVLGLGGGGYQLKLDTEFDTVNVGTLSCIGIKALRATFHIEPTILVASNYPVESCEYKAVRKHELEHVNILRRFQSLYSTKYKLLLQKLAAQNQRYVVTSSVNNAFQKSQIEKAMVAEIEQFVRDIKPVLVERQLKHDSAEEYARVAAQCKNW